MKLLKYIINSIGFVFLILTFSGCAYYVKTVDVPIDSEIPFYAKCNEYNVDVVLSGTGGKVKTFTQTHPILSATVHCGPEDTDVLPDISVYWNLDMDIDTEPQIQNNMARTLCKTIDGSIIRATRVRLLCWNRQENLRFE